MGIHRLPSEGKTWCHCLVLCIALPADALVRRRQRTIDSTLVARAACARLDTGGYLLGWAADCGAVLATFWWVARGNEACIDSSRCVVAILRHFWLAMEPGGRRLVTVQLVNSVVETVISPLRVGGTWLRRVTERSLRGGLRWEGPHRGVRRHQGGRGGTGGRTEGWERSASSSIDRCLHDIADAVPRRDCAPFGNRGIAVRDLPSFAQDRL